jgi:hypothetical protein
VSILKRIGRLSAVVVALALATGLAPSGERVSEICVIGGDIHYCAPKNL